MINHCETSEYFLYVDWTKNIPQKIQFDTFRRALNPENDEKGLKNVIAENFRDFVGAFFVVSVF